MKYLFNYSNYFKKFIKYSVNYSTKAKSHAGGYKETLYLPYTKFPQRLSPVNRAEVEAAVNKKSLLPLYQWQRKHLDGPEFILHDGPPYANGDLHVGHAVNKILKDITNKYYITARVRVHYVPGWDCHGLPIELKVNTSQRNLSPIEIREQARNFAEQVVENQRKGFCDWGVMADWSSEIYRTFEVDYIINQLNCFYELYSKGLIFRDLKPIYWSPSSKSALAEAELEYDPNYESPSLTFRVKISKCNDRLRELTNNSIIYGLVWTTTPWTLPANQAICFNSSLEYSLVKIDDSEDCYLLATGLIEQLEKQLNKSFQKIYQFVGSILTDTCYLDPIDHIELKFYPANYVDGTKGTGLVHTAPAHGHDDFLIGLENGLTLKNLVDEDGNYNDKAPKFLQQKSVLNDGNNLVLDYLKSDVIINEKIIHSYPIDWRTKQPVIIRASQQWFIDTSQIKTKAISELEAIRLYPEKLAQGYTHNLINQLKSRPYWCISRQRIWGTPIPVIYNRTTKQSIVDREIIDRFCALLKSTGDTDIWWKLDITEFIPQSFLDKSNIRIDELERGRDILDIWFDSGISWSYALEGDKIADLYLEGHDQFSGWFQSSLTTSVGLRDIAPYRSIFVHGFVVDENGIKMSKSIGNVIDPADITKKYGSDVLRWWVASHGTQHSLIPISDNLLKMSAETVNKIRHNLKYLLGVIGQKQLSNKIVTETLCPLDIYFLNSLLEFDDRMKEAYRTYQYNWVTKHIVNFITNDVSGFYLHLIKDRLYCDSRENHEILQNVLTILYYTLNKSLWPLIPFTVEEGWGYYDETTNFYQFEFNLIQFENPKYNELFTVCKQIKRSLNQENNINTWLLDVKLECDLKTAEQLKSLHPIIGVKITDSDLCELLQVSSITLTDDRMVEGWAIHTKPIIGDLCERCRRFEATSYSHVCLRCISILK